MKPLRHFAQRETRCVVLLQVIRPEEAGVLYSLVFGEGVMNDATSVALLRAVQVLLLAVIPPSAFEVLDYVRHGKLHRSCLFATVPI